MTEDYPDDATSRLDRPGVFRVSIGVGREAARREVEAEAGEAADPSALDRVRLHPVYGALGWVAVLNPGPRAADTTRTLLCEAHEAARARHRRRAGPSRPAQDRGQGG